LAHKVSRSKTALVKSSNVEFSKDFAEENSNSNNCSDSPTVTTVNYNLKVTSSNPHANLLLQAGAAFLFPVTTSYGE
jgi:hypothetical protein